MLRPINRDLIKFECRLSGEPGLWKIVEAPSPEAAAADFLAATEAERKTWPVGTAQSFAYVVVRALTNVNVSACYRVTGETVYSAAIVLPGQAVAA